MVLMSPSILCKIRFLYALGHVCAVDPIKFVPIVSNVDDIGNFMYHVAL